LILTSFVLKDPKDAAGIRPDLAIADYNIWELALHLELHEWRHVYASKEEWPLPYDPFDPGAVKAWYSLKDDTRIKRQYLLALAYRKKVVCHFGKTAVYEALLDMPKTCRKRGREFKMDVLEDDMDAGRRMPLPAPRRRGAKRPRVVVHAAIADDAVDAASDNHSGEDNGSESEAGDDDCDDGGASGEEPPGEGDGDAQPATPDVARSRSPSIGIGVRTPSRAGSPAPYSPSSPKILSPAGSMDGDADAAPADAKSTSSSSTSSSSSSSSSASSESSPSGAEPKGRGKSKGPAKEKKERKFDWGGFSIAPIHPGGGCQKGWGATCYRHRNAATPKARCKKTINISAKFTRSEALLRLKMWCLMGQEVAPDHPAGRTRHRDMDMKLCDLWEEDMIEFLKPVVTAADDLEPDTADISEG
jgi:hypothetical protein